MKSKLLIVSMLAGLALAYMPCSVKADEATNAVPTASPDSIWQDVKKLAQDDISFFGTNHVITCDVGGIYSDHKWGGVVNVHTPLPIGTNGQVAIGIATAYIDHSLYSAAVSLKAGTTWNNVPLLKTIYLWAETGPGMNLHQHQAIVQTFAGGTWGFDVWKGHKIYISGMTGNISDRPGMAYGGTLSTTFKW